MAKPVTQDSDADQYRALNDRLARLERVAFDTAEVINNINNFQSGTTSFAPGATSGDGADFIVTLPTAWASTHDVFIAQVWPRSTWTGFAIRGSIPSGLTSGTVHVQNSSVGQTFDVVWISIGT
jgi:hypothetical protein